MKANKAIIIGVALLLIPAMSMAALAQEQEQGTQEGPKGQELGKFASRRLIAISFNPSIKEEIRTTEGELYFYIMDGRNSISRIASDLLYDKIVYVVYENDTANSTLLQPDQNGTFNVSLPKVGTYTIVVRLQPSIPIPLISNFVTPSDADTITVIRQRAFPMTIIIICAIVAITGFGGLYIWKAMKKRELKEK